MVVVQAKPLEGCLIQYLTQFLSTPETQGGNIEPKNNSHLHAQSFDTLSLGTTNAMQLQCFCDITLRFWLWLYCVAKVVAVTGCDVCGLEDITSQPPLFYHSTLPSTAQAKNIATI